MEKEAAGTKLDDALCQFSKGEERGAHLLRQLLDFAPDEDVRRQVAQQVIDEERHHRLFSTRLQHLELDCEGMKKHLASLYDLAQACVDRRDWAECMAIQAAIEELAMASFGHAIKTMALDTETRTAIMSVIADERRHLEFGMGQLRQLAATPQEREKIRRIQEQAMALLRESAVGGYAKKEVLLQAYRAHQARCKAIGIDVPSLA
jgi:rubrerythrin